jgi:ubiquinone/menaquinone biosynthesis C-methylase UbiE
MEDKSMTQKNLAPAPDRRFLPAMGKRWLLPLYDPFTRFAGVAAVHGALLARAEVGPGDRVLDIGCGTGSLLVTLGRKEPDAVLTGLDPDPAALGRARRKAARAGVQVSLDRGFADELPYPDASLDRVLSSMMLHHLDRADRARALTEAHRVLRPGGRFVLIDAAHSTGGHQHRMGGHLGRKMASNGEPSEEALRASVGSAGFSAVQLTVEPLTRLGPVVLLTATP